MSTQKVIRTAGTVLLMTIFCLAGFSCVSGAKTVTRAKVEKAINKVYPALVRISVIFETPANGRIVRKGGVGSGTVITPEGHILTNHHVVNKNPVKISVRFSNREELPAELIGTDPLTDLAIIKVDLSKRIDKTPIDIPKFGNSDLVEVGDPVMALGSPAALSQSVTLGVASNIGMMAPGGNFKLDGEDVGQLVRWIGHDAVIFGGNSGGPLINLEGEIVGVNEVGIGSLGGAIPSNLAKNIASELIETGKITRSWTGMNCRPTLKSSVADGVLVNSVIKDSPADKAGIKPGDIVTQFHGHKIRCNYREEMSDFNNIAFSLPPETEVKMLVNRKGEELPLTMITEERDEVQSISKEVKEIGITIQNLTRVSALHLKRKNKDGVYINSLNPGGAAARSIPAIPAGAVITEVNGNNVKSTEDFLNEIAKEDNKWLIKYEVGEASYLSVVRSSEDPGTPPPKSRKTWLGASLQVINRHLKEKIDFKNSYGVRLTKVSKNSPAEKAGLKKGDIITHMDGIGVEASQQQDIANFTNLIQSYKAGEEVTFKVIRDKKDMTLKCKLDLSPEENNSIENFEDSIFEFSVVHKKKDISVNKVTTGGWASLAGLRSGDKIMEINGIKISDIKSLGTALNNLQDTNAEHAVFFIKRGQYTYFLECSPVWNQTNKRNN